jgi:O-antigen ligase
VGKAPIGRGEQQAKGSFTAPLFFLALSLASFGSTLGAVTLWLLAALALAAAGWSADVEQKPYSVFWLVALLFGGLIVFNSLVLSPAYTPAGLYQPLLLVAAFVFSRGLAERTERAVLRAALIAGAALALWGLTQSGYLGMARARAFLETPAIFAGVLNLLLVPLLAAVLVGRHNAASYALALALAGAMFAADSRGGMVALAAGFGVALVLAMRARLLSARGAATALGLIAAGWLLVAALRALPAEQLDAPPDASERAESSLSRLELYALSLEAWRARPVLGTGYLTFRYALEQGRAHVPSYGTTGETWFVHNDYLQILQEVGPAGLLALLGLTALPLVLVYRRLPELPGAEQAVVIAAAAALFSMSVHALVDFPFYVPVCLLLYGAWLGAIDRRLLRRVTAAKSSRALPPWHRLARAAAMAVAGVLLFRPALAEVSAEWGLRKSSAGEGQDAALWLGVAQRVDPRDWRYHWYAGQFWNAQAEQSGKPEAARLAARAYAAGFEANPLEVRNLLGMISVHRRHARLLDAPADLEILRRWQARAVELAPFHPGVRREHAR